MDVWMYEWNDAFWKTCSNKDDNKNIIIIIIIIII